MPLVCEIALSSEASCFAIKRQKLRLVVEPSSQVLYNAVLDYSCLNSTDFNPCRAFFLFSSLWDHFPTNDLVNY